MLMQGVDEEAIDDVQEEFDQEVHDDDEGGLLVADTREPESGEEMEQASEEVEAQEVLDIATVEKNKRKDIRVREEEKLFSGNKPNCAIKFKLMSELSRHIKVVNEKERLHPCKHKECLKKFGSKSTLD